MDLNGTSLKYLYEQIVSISRGHISNFINRLLLKLYDPLTMRSFLCSIGDIMLEREKGMYNRQFIVICRLLDVERYRTTHDLKFPFQNKLSSATTDKMTDLNNRFYNLIESVDRNGYNVSSTLTVNNELFLLDGTHRTAMMLEKGIDVIRVKSMRRKCIVSSNCFCFLQKNIQTDDFRIIWDRFKQLNADLMEKGISFGLWIEENSFDSYEEVMSLLKPFVVFHKVLSVENADFCINGFNCNKGVYAMFLPNRTDYVIKKDGYYSNYIKELRNYLVDYCLHNSIKPDFFYLTNNCLEGQTIYNSISTTAITRSTNIDFIYG